MCLTSFQYFEYICTPLSLSTVFQCLMFFFLAYGKIGHIHDLYLDDVLPPIDDDTPPVEEKYGDDMLFPPERRAGPAPFDLEMEMALYIEATYTAALSHMSHSQRIETMLRKWSGVNAT